MPEEKQQKRLSKDNFGLGKAEFYLFGEEYIPKYMQYVIRAHLCVGPQEITKALLPHIFKGPQISPHKKVQIYVQLSLRTR